MQNRRISLAFVSAMARASRQIIEGSTICSNASASNHVSISRDKDRHGEQRGNSKEAACTMRAG